MSALTVGEVIPETAVRFSRADLRAYAQASGDHNPIHLDEAVATAVGLPGVIAHGMLTMGHAARLVGEAAGAVGAVRAISVRFTRPVVVPADDADPSFAEGVFSGNVTAVDEEAGLATIAITATCNGQTVLARAQATVSLPTT